MNVLGIIPARYHSSRFPGKPLVNIHGKSMIQRVYEQAKKCKELNDLIIATDDIRIFTHVKSFNGNVKMTAKNHQSGTDRCAEIIQKIDKKFDVIINIQGDEPTINPQQISNLIKLFKKPHIEIGTLAKKITSDIQINDPNVVKVMFDKNNIALSFFREREKSNNMFFKHIGIYAFKESILLKITKLKETKNESKYNLEQLRWLDNHYKISICETVYDNISVDTEEDLNKLLKQEFNT